MKNTHHREELCRKTAQELMTYKDWRLLSESSFTQAILNHKQPITAEDIKNIGINTYCEHALYPACIGAWGEEKRQRGIEELANYINGIGNRNGLSQDVIQDAIVNVLSKIHTCRKPGAILKFVGQKLKDAKRRDRKQNRPEISLGEISETDIYRIDQNGNGNDRGLEVVILMNEDQDLVVDALDRSKRLHPRAYFQLEAAYLRHYEGLDHKEIAEQLGMKPGRIYILIHRGMCKLRSDPHMEQLAKDIYDV